GQELGFVEMALDDRPKWFDGSAHASPWSPDAGPFCYAGAVSKAVYANGMAIACKAGSARVVAAFPSVCQSPPGPPSGPLPVPYPLSSCSRDVKQGSRRVKIGGQPVALYGKSYYVSKQLGNEAATRSFGASMVNHQLVGKTKYAAGSIDVRFESA